MKTQHKRYRDRHERWSVWTSNKNGWMTLELFLPTRYASPYPSSQQVITKGIKKKSGEWGEKDSLHIYFKNREPQLDMQERFLTLNFLCTQVFPRTAWGSTCASSHTSRIEHFRSITYICEGTNMSCKLVVRCSTNTISILLNENLKSRKSQ